MSRLFPIVPMLNTSRRIPLALSFHAFAELAALHLEVRNKIPLKACSNRQHSSCKREQRAANTSQVCGSWCGHGIHGSLDRPGPSDPYSF